jgi:hypothetical protein
MLDHEKWRLAMRTGGDGVLPMWWRFASWCSRRLTAGRAPAEQAGMVVRHATGDDVGLL